MSSKVPYHPIRNLSDDPQITTPKSKMNRLLQYIPQAQNTKQAIKKRFKVLHRISFEAKEPPQPLGVPRIQRLTTNLKRLKHISHLGIDMSSLLCSEKIPFRFFESLKHTKNFNEIHFYSTDPWTYYSEELALVVSQVLRSLRILPKMKIKLSLPFSSSYLNKNLFRLLKSFHKHKCFTSVQLNFGFCYTILAVQEVMTTLSSSKSLSELSLTLKGTNFTHKNSDQLPHDVFRTLKNMKTVKNCRVHFHDCVITNSELKGLVPVLKEAGQTLNLEIIVEIINKIALLSRSEWWLFKRSIRNPNSSHPIYAKHKGELKNLSQKESYALPLVGFIFGYLITSLMLYLFDLLKELS